MKRALLFLVLLSIGVGVLRWVQGASPTGTVPDDDVASLPWTIPDQGAVSGLTPGGALQVSKYLEADTGGRRPTEFMLDAEDSGTEESGASIYLTGVRVRYLEPETQVERMHLTAARAVARRVEGTAGFTPELDPLIRLFEVEVTILDGAPVVPLVLRVPELLLDIDARTLESREAVTLDGPGLAGRGTGIFVDEPSRVLRLDLDGSLSLDGYSGSGGVLSSSGPLTVRRPKGSEEELEVRASRDARLSPVGPEGSVTPEGLWADEILLFGRDDAERGIAVTAIDAWRADRSTELVRYVQGEHELIGGRAHVDLDDAGEPKFARLTEDPRATLVVDKRALAALGSAEIATNDELQAGTVDATSAGALELRWREDGIHFSADGPATFTTPDAILLSDGPASGRLASEGSGAAFRCEGGVRLESDTASLVTRTLDVYFERDLSDVPVMIVRADGRPLVNATSSDGREIRLASEGSLDLERRGDLWTVPRAEKVELTVLGEGGLHARADLVEDFDPATIALVATGNVEVETAEGIATGHSLKVRDRQSFTLEGRDEERATFESTEGTASARGIQRDGERVTLRRDVEAKLVPSARADETYVVDCDALTLTRGVGAEGLNVVRTFHLDARGVRKASVQRAEERIEFSCDALDGRYREMNDPENKPVERFSTFQARTVHEALLVRTGQAPANTRIQSEELGATRLVLFSDGELLEEQGEAVARGNVVFDGEADSLPFKGSADELRVERDGTLFARASEGKKVEISGNLPSHGKPYELEALWVRSTAEELEAEQPELVVLSLQDGEGDEADVGIHGRADRLTSTQEHLILEGKVHVDGVTEEAVPWQLDAGHARFEGSLRPGEQVSREDVSALFASRGVRLSLPGRDLIATGETLRAKRLSGIMRFDGIPARINSPDLEFKSEWIEIDIALGRIVGSGRGGFNEREQEDSTQEDGGQSIGSTIPDVTFARMQSLEEADSIIYVFEEPRFTHQGPELEVFLPVLPSGDITISASWGILWVDREGLASLGSGEEEGAVAEEQEGPKRKKSIGARLFDQVRQWGVVNEVYLEGPVELSIQGQPTATASAVYLDVVSGNGWLADASFTVTPEAVGRDVSPLRVHAKWLRQSDDDTFHADEARVSFSQFDDPGLEIVTGDLRIEPNKSNPEHFNVVLRDNKIRVYDMFALPLPSIDWTTDESGKPILSTLRLGSSARFGSFVSAGVVRPASGAARALHSLIGRKGMGVDLDPDFDVDVDIEGQYSLDASWLGSRGVLLDGGFYAEAEGQYRWVTQLGGIPDGDEDRGFLRVDEADRDTLRLWARTRGRYLLGEDEWLDFSGSWQSDAGVQAEFFENQFTRYEQTESFLRWRNVQDELMFSATAAVNIDDFQSRIEELPALRAWRGRAQILPLGPASLVYDAHAEAAYLDRKESDGGFASPFGLPAEFEDGLGDRDVLRFDTTHRLEVPMSLGALGLRATPFVLGRFSAWSEDITGEDNPTRAFAQAGLRLATPLWKRASNGGVHQLVPYAAARQDLALETSGGDPVVFDSVEDSLEGRFVDVGVRGRFALVEGRSLLDMDVRATHVGDVASGTQAGWTELGFFTRLNIKPFQVPVQVSHDGRYDVETGDTLYSRVALGLRPTQALGLEAAHHRGLDFDREALFEAASIRGIYTWTPKWEFEGRQTFSLLEDGGRLGSGVILRRYGHDLVFEIESSFRQGEGASIGLNIRPLFSFNRPDIGDISF